MLWVQSSHQQSRRDRGHVLVTTLAVVLILSILSMTALFLAGQDVPGISAMKEEAVAQHLADAAVEVVVSWFHDARTTPPSLTELFAKRKGNPLTGPSFFDDARRSQFLGTADRPDLLLDAADPGDDRILNAPPSGFPGTLRELGRLTRVKVYGPLRPGLLGTLEVTATTLGRKPIARTVQMQLGALVLPAVRAAVQVGQGLGTLVPGGEAPLLVHWGDLRIGGDLAVKRIEEIVLKSSSAPVTGQPYEQTEQRLDRWVDYWIGGDLSVALPPPGQGIHPIPPENVHVHQAPAPGVRIDQWDYESTKKAALRHGTYFRLDRQGQLHAQGASDGDPGRSPSEVLNSQAIGDHRGMLFIDTIDGEPPRPDNLGTLVLDAEYLEALLVVQGHVVVRSRGTGQSVSVLSPPPEGMISLATRVPAQLSGIHLNGLLWAAGTITIERSIRVYGAVMAGGSVIASTAGVQVEVWYNSDFAQGLYRGVPVVFRAPGTWRVL